MIKGKAFLGIAMAHMMALQATEQDSIKLKPRRSVNDGVMASLQDYPSTPKQRFGSMANQKRRRKMIRQNPSLRKKYGK